MLVALFVRFSCLAYELNGFCCGAYRVTSENGFTLVVSLCIVC
jgi:hypothetical protein